ncbi:MAG TPA: META domain-containing protein [Burkholderiales bacterium]|nr:META domain-containing protein [Burkholderiales bacterium]
MLKWLAGFAIALGIQACTLAQTKPDEPLENTYWRLDWLAGAAVSTAPGAREPHFVLHRDGRRVTGSGGCNRFTGSYDLSGERLSFGKMAGTMMACQESMETERAFLQALGKAQTALVREQQLELLDAAGNTLARFEAVHFR